MKINGSGCYEMIYADAQVRYWDTESVLSQTSLRLEESSQSWRVPASGWVPHWGPPVEYPPVKK